MYQEMGLTRATAEAVAGEVHQDPELAVKVHIVQELGVDPDEQPSPWTAAFSSFGCFAVGGDHPADPVPARVQLAGPRAARRRGRVWSRVGALTSRFTTRPWWLAGLRQLVFGVIAASATYLVGWLIGVNVGG